MVYSFLTVLFQKSLTHAFCVTVKLLVRRMFVPINGVSSRALDVPSSKTPRLALVATHPTI